MEPVEYIQAGRSQCPTPSSQRAKAQVERLRHAALVTELGQQGHPQRVGHQLAIESGRTGATDYDTQPRRHMVQSLHDTVSRCDGTHVCR